MHVSLLHLSFHILFKPDDVDLDPNPTKVILRIIWVFEIFFSIFTKMSDYFIRMMKIESTRTRYFLGKRKKYGNVFIIIILYR